MIECEVCKALKELANRKAPGVDEKSNTLFKVVLEEAINIRTDISAHIWSRIVWPKEWKQSVYVPLPRKEGPRECSNK